MAIYLLQVENGTYDEPYTNPGGITHVITGSAVSYNQFFFIALKVWTLKKCDC